MSPTEWAAVGSSVGVIGLATGFIGHIIRYSYKEGQRDQRIKAMEEKVDTEADCKSELSKLAMKMEMMEVTLKEVSHDLKNIMTGRVSPMRRMVNDG